MTAVVRVDRITKDKIVVGASKAHTGPGIVLYSFVKGEFCSVCAPRDMDKNAVESETHKIAQPRMGRWQVRDAAEFGGSSKSPSPCNQHPAGRKHWFLICVPLDG